MRATASQIVVNTNSPSMEISPRFSTASRGYGNYCYSSPSESVQLRRLRLPIRHHQCLQSEVAKRWPVSQNRKGKLLKVSCLQKKEIPIIEGRCMDDMYDVLAKRLVPTAALASNTNSKLIVGLASLPGAGKSTLAHEVVKRVNKLWAPKASSFDSQVEPPNVATVLPMDGFHLYRCQLDAMENPKEAHARRGAPWTFDPALLLTRLKTLREKGSVYVPSFDHGVGDPVEDDILIGMQHKVVLVEGNYLFLEEGIWNEISAMFDEKWFIDIDIDTSMQRVLNRHISTGKPPDVAKWRIDYNDRPNAELVLKSKKNADLVIKSICY